MLFRSPCSPRDSQESSPTPPFKSINSLCSAFFTVKLSHPYMTNGKTIALTNLKPVHCSMSGSNCFFLTCIQISQEASKVVWYSHLLKHFPQFIVIHTVKGFGIVNKTEIYVFLELSCFFHDPEDVGNLISDGI